MIKANVTANTGRPLKAWNQKDSNRVGLQLRKNVKERTADGVSASGAAFVPYTAAYAAKHGSNVDLRDTGKLMNSLVLVADKDGAVVFTRVPYAEAVNAERPFMGTAPDEVDELMEIIARQYDKHAAEANKGGGAAISPRKV